MPIHRASTLKPYIWEHMEIGEQFGPVEGVVSELKLKPTRLRLTITAPGISNPLRSAAGSATPPVGHRHPDALHPQL